MQDQPRPGRPSLDRRQEIFEQRRRAMLVGAVLAIAGLVVLLWPHGRPPMPTEGSDPATLAALINLPAVPSAVHWALTPVGTGTEPGDLSKGHWRLQAEMTFAPADAAKISGPEAFYKAPFLSGQLQRLDANRFSLQLTSP